MEQTDMRLSIVVNMYNTASFLPRCMDTLLHQDISPDSYEIILVDDGSTDNSLALAQEYAAKSMLDVTMPTIRVEHHANKGLAGARNTGLRTAKGQYLCFVDPDDYIQENSLSVLLQQMDEERLDILRFNYQKVDEDENNISDSPMEYIFDYTPKLMTGIEFMKNRLTTSCYVWAYIYRRELIVANNIYFDETCYFDDVPWLPRLLPFANRMNIIDDRHLYYTQRKGSLVHTVNTAAIKRKVDGQINLLRILQSHKPSAQIVDWYNRMNTHLVVSILTTVANNLYSMRNEYIEKIKEYNIFPLFADKMLKNNRHKIALINLNPKLYMWLIKIKNNK